jgi:pimeloyl-ACP methyl ester carboxylesterase
MRITGTAAMVAAAAFGLSAAGCASAGSALDGGSAGGGPSRTSATGPGSPAAPAVAPPAPAPQSAIAQLCGPPDGPGRLVTIRAADGARLAAIEAGRGTRGVVLVPEAGRSGKCGWWAFAAFLAAHGYHVVAFDHRCTGASGCPAGRADGDLMSDIRGVVARLRHDGAARVALIGASQGGAEVLISAAVPPPGVTGVVALSADELTIPLASAPYPATAVAAVPRLRLPVLFAVARSDPYVTVPDTRRLLARSGAASKRLVVLPARAGHGWDMVSPPPAGGPVPGFGWTVLAFLRGRTA